MSIKAFQEFEREYKNINYNPTLNLEPGVRTAKLEDIRQKAILSTGLTPFEKRLVDVVVYWANMEPTLEIRRETNENPTL
jgi:hypothetical protein